MGQMTKPVRLRSIPSRVGRRQPLLQRSDCSFREERTAAGVGEVAGGTMAGCAAVCCCCPCGLADLLVLVVCKVPAGLCRKAIRRKRHRRQMREGLLPPRRSRCCCDEMEMFHMQPVTSPLAMVTFETAAAGEKEMLELEEEMWGQFYRAGFWRSPSQRSEISAVQSNLIN